MVVMSGIHIALALTPPPTPVSAGEGQGLLLICRWATRVDLF